MLVNSIWGRPLRNISIIRFMSTPQLNASYVSPKNSVRIFNGQVQDLPLHFGDFCRGNPCGCPTVGQFSKIDRAVSRYESRPTQAQETNNHCKMSTRPSDVSYDKIDPYAGTSGILLDLQSPRGAIGV